MLNRAVFLDRDGTLNEDPGYLGNPSKLVLFPGTGKALNLLKKSGFKLIVISNQSGIARGLITKEMVDVINRRLNELLRSDETSIDAFYFCPSHPDFSPPEECTCRKPSPEMVLQAAKDHHIDLGKSFFIGDAISDMECGFNAGCRAILVKTGYGAEALSILQKQNKIPSFVAENLAEACNYIINQVTEN